MNLKKEIKFRNEPITLNFFCYNDGRIGFLMVNSETNEFLGNGSLQLECNIPNTEIIVKSYRNNIGLYECLLENNIIKSYRRMMQIGNDLAHVCELEESILNYFKIK
jgi:hypothetical protein